MSKLLSFLTDQAAKLKQLLNSLLNTQKPKAKAFIHAKADEYYSRIDGVTSVATVAGLADYLQSKAGDNPLGAAVTSKLRDLITAGIALGLVETGLNAADALTKKELDKIVGFIDQKIDGARL